MLAQARERGISIIYAMQTVLDSPAMVPEAFPLNAMLCIPNGKIISKFLPTPGSVYGQ
jgi:hypothetical protein